MGEKKKEQVKGQRVGGQLLKRGQGKRGMREQRNKGRERREKGGMRKERKRKGRDEGIRGTSRTCANCTTSDL